jgi:cadmium resistance protein CadD (predicted permease)
MLATIGLSVVLFASTNIDDIFVLFGFFADRRYRATHVVLGQYLGIAALVAVAVVASLIALVIPSAYVGLLGLLPILLGAKNLLDLRHGDSEPETHVPALGHGPTLAVAAVTVANGGDNIGVYTPVFATSASTELVCIVAVFAVMVAIWLWFSHWLVSHPDLGAPLRKWGHIVTPLVLIAIGVAILYRAGSFELLS